MEYCQQAPILKQFVRFFHKAREKMMSHLRQPFLSLLRLGLLILILKMGLTAFSATLKRVLNSLASNFSPPTIRPDIRVTYNSYHGLPIVILPPAFLATTCGFLSSSLRIIQLWNTLWNNTTKASVSHLHEDPIKLQKTTLHLRRP